MSSKFFDKLFGKKKASLYHIEIHDKEIDEEISELIIRLQKSITTFKMELDHNDHMSREEELKELYTNMSRIQNKVKILISDVQKITQVKLEHEQFFTIKDNSFLQDKEQQLQTMRHEIETFLSIVEQQPSLRELQEDLFAQLVEQLNGVVTATNKIISDDYYLREIYKKLRNII